MDMVSDLLRGENTASQADSASVLWSQVIQCLP